MYISQILQAFKAAALENHWIHLFSNYFYKKILNEKTTNFITLIIADHFL